MIRCSRCGNTFDEQYGVCPYCGFMLVPGDYSAEKPASDPEKKKIQSKKPLIVLICILTAVLIIGIVICIAVLTSGKGTSEYEQQISLGEKYLSEEKYDDAIAAFKKAINIDPNDPDAYLGLADVYIAMGNDDEAVRVLEEGLEKTGSSKIREKIETTGPELEVYRKLLEQDKISVGDKEIPSDEVEFICIDLNHDMKKELIIRELEFEALELPTYILVGYPRPEFSFNTDDIRIEYPKQGYTEIIGYYPKNKVIVTDEVTPEKENRSYCEVKETTVECFIAESKPSGEDYDKYYIVDGKQKKETTEKKFETKLKQKVGNEQMQKFPEKWHKNTEENRKKYLPTKNEKAQENKKNDDPKPIDDYKDPDYTLGKIVASGNCGDKGDNVTWELDDNGLLVISGNGEMGDYPFDNKPPWYEKNIKKLIIKHGVTSIGEFAFCKCESLTNITIPNSVTRIKWYAFQKCTSLTEITIPDSVTDIEQNAFSVCTSLTSVTVPDSAIWGHQVFSGCESLTNFTFNEANTKFISIDGVVFTKDMSELMICPGSKNGNYEIPEGVTKIRGYAFYGCKNISSITIPESVTEIGGDAFLAWTSSQTIYIKGRSQTPKEWAYTWNEHCDAKIVWNA